jgi:hypothetical protein
MAKSILPQLTDLAEEFVETIVGPNPHPCDRVASSFTDCTVLLVDTDGPDVLISAEFFEA